MEGGSNVFHAFNCICGSNRRLAGCNLRAKAESPNQASFLSSPITPPILTVRAEKNGRRIRLTADYVRENEATLFHI